MSDPVADAILALRDEIREFRQETRSRFLSAKGERERLCHAVEGAFETCQRIEAHNLEAHDRDGKRMKNVEATAERAERSAQHAHRRIDAATGCAE